MNDEASMGVGRPVLAGGAGDQGAGETTGGSRTSVPPAGSQVAGDGVKCVVCEYDLRGMPLEGVCPECGASVARAVHGNSLELANPAWLKKTFSGVNTVYNVTILQIVFNIVGTIWLSNAAAAARGTPQSIATVAIIFAAGNFLLVVLYAAGVWAMTRPEPGTDIDESTLSPRRLAAVGAILLPLISILSSLLVEALADSLPAMGLGLVSIFVLAMVLLRLGLLVRRIPGEERRGRGLVLRGRILAWLTCIIFVLFGCSLYGVLAPGPGSALSNVLAVLSIVLIVVLLVGIFFGLIGLGRGRLAFAEFIKNGPKRIWNEERWRQAELGAAASDTGGPIAGEAGISTSAGSFAPGGLLHRADRAWVRNLLTGLNVIYAAYILQFLLAFAGGGLLGAFIRAAIVTEEHGRVPDGAKAYFLVLAICSVLVQALCAEGVMRFTKREPGVTDAESGLSMRRIALIAVFVAVAAQIGRLILPKADDVNVGEQLAFVMVALVLAAVVRRLGKIIGRLPGEEKWAKRFRRRGAVLMSFVVVAIFLAVLKGGWLAVQLGEGKESDQAFEVVLFLLAIFLWLVLSIALLVGVVSLARGRGILRDAIAAMPPPEKGSAAAADFAADAHASGSVKTV